MNKSTYAGLLLASALLAPGLAAADPVCGADTGEAATGATIKVGGIHGNAAPGDFSSATDAAGAYFACVNANGGINGRPIEYMVENDQWNPELAAQALCQAGPAMKMSSPWSVTGRFVEMSVNAGYYAENGIMAMASACAVSECFESSNIVSTNQGPLPSSIGAAMYAVEELGATNVSCIGLAIPSVRQLVLRCGRGIHDLQGPCRFVGPAQPGGPRRQLGPARSHRPRARIRSS